MPKLTLEEEEEAANHKLLQLANEKGKFAIQLGLEPIEAMQYAFERGIDNEWFTFVDVSYLQHTPKPVLMRVFRLTNKGWQKRIALEQLFGELNQWP